MTPFFSIIIPVYNGVSTGLPECLDSIWGQPLDEDLYEVIAVDDCSTDHTRAWLHGQERRHPNLRVLENEVNIRQGGRNRGVKAAKGQYILFIDQDDYYHPGSIAKVYEHLKEHPGLDVLMTDSSFQYKYHESNKLQLNLRSEEVYDSGVDFMVNNGWAIAPWRFCIRRDFYVDKELWFAEGCRIEDVDWVFKLFRHARRMKYYRLLLIHYNKGTGSTTDNAYRNMEILRAGQLAACRLHKVAETLYADTQAQPIVKDIAEFYWNCNCRTLCGSFLPVGEKRELIEMVPIRQSKYRLLNFAVKHPTIFCALTNLAVVPFRVARYFVRKVKARKFEGE